MTSGTQPPRRIAEPVSPLLRRLTLVALLTTLVLVAVGGLVRATESGLGCGDDWPVCNGQVIPEGNHHTWIEFSHRVIAAVLVGLTVALAVVAWRRARQRSDLVRLAVATVPLVLAQAVLGAVVVALELHAESVVAHLALAMTLLAVIIALAVRQWHDPGELPVDPSVPRAVWPVAVGALAVMLLGSYMSGREAGLAYTDWPLFDGGVVPSTRGSLGWIHGAHRIAALAAGSGIAVVALWLRRHQAPLIVRRLVVAAGILFAVQVMLGAANVWLDLHAATRTAHLATGAVIWALLAGAALVAGRVPSGMMREMTSSTPVVGATASDIPAATEDPAPVREGAAGPLSRARAYFMLTKPRVIELLLVTTVPAMVLAEGGVPSLGLVAAVLLGGAFAAGGANTINCYIDRDRDANMRRTHHRPLPAGDVDPTSALWFGIVLEAAAFGWLTWTANLLAASLAIAATLFYVFVYSIWLKPKTAQNIVIGGAAGAVPVLVGWAAVERGIAPPAWILFAIIFVWTPPHFWALAMRYRDDYAAAGVPMLPVVAGIEATTRQILLYSFAVVAVTLVLWPVGDLGAVYLLTAVGLGAAFVWRAFRLRREGSTSEAMRLFMFSNVYLALLFAAVALDVVIVHGV